MNNNATKIYFASDLHLGSKVLSTNAENEKRFVRWLEEIRKDATAIYLLGDIFDFWFEYKQVVPKGFVRLLGTLADITDSGIPIKYFTGNHDAWTFGYLEKEIGVKVHYKKLDITLADKKFQIGHGDGLGSGDGFYRFMKIVMDNKLCRFIFRWIHPDIGISIANRWSMKSRLNNYSEQNVTFDKETDWLLQYCREELKREHYDYFIFGHSHLNADYKINTKGSRYINLGEWFSKYTYGIFDGKDFELKTFEK